MPGSARIDAPGALHHIIARGTGRRKIFDDDADRDAFLERLGPVISESGTICYAWALIPNHFHLLLRTGQAPVSSVMRRLLTGYAMGYNREFVQKGLSMGKRDDLTGGGLVRSAGGWSAVKALRRAKTYMKGDARVLGDSEFVQSVLKQSEQACDRRYRLKARGVDLDPISHRVTELMDIPMDELWSRGKHPHVVKARSLLCYWAVHELHMSMSELARRFEVSATAISKSVLRDKALAKKHDFELE